MGRLLRLLNTCTRWLDEVRNPKSVILRNSEILNPNRELPQTAIRVSDFGFLSAFHPPQYWNRGHAPHLARTRVQSVRYIRYCYGGRVGFRSSEFDLPQPYSPQSAFTCATPALTSS